MPWISSRTSARRSTLWVDLLQARARAYTQRALMTARLRVRFLRDMLRAVERDAGAGALERLKARLPDRLRPHVDAQALAASKPSDSLSLDDGEEVLLAVESALGDNTGRLLESASFDLVARTVSQGNMLVVGDLLATVARMRAPLEWPFLSVQMMFDLVPTDTGFSLTLGIPGRPRSARILRHVAAGTIRAAQRYCREANVDGMELMSGVFGDRANVTAHYHAPRAVPEADAAPRPARKVTQRSLRRTTQPRLSEEVERILSAPPGAPSQPPEPLSLRSDRPRTSPSGTGERISSFPPARPSSRPPKK